MPIAAPVNKAARVRLLAQQHPYLSPADIAANTGYRLAEVKAALGRGEARKQPKSRTVEASDLLTAVDLAGKLRDGSARNGLN